MRCVLQNPSRPRGLETISYFGLLLPIPLRLSPPLFRETPRDVTVLARSRTCGHLELLIFRIENLSVRGNGMDYASRNGLRPRKKPHMFLVRLFIKKRAGERFFFCYLLFPIACFLYTLLPSPRDTLEL